MANDREKARLLWDRFEFMYDNGHEDFVDEADENEGIYTGDRQWEEEDETELKNEGRPCETINQILPKINNIVGEQIAQRSEIILKPRDNEADVQTAMILSKVFKHIQQVNRFDDLMTDTFEDGLITGRGYLTAGIGFKKPGNPGDVVLKRKHPKTILLDPLANSYDPEDWMDWIETRWMSFNDIEALFGMKKAKELEGKTLGTDEETFGPNSMRPYTFAGDELKGKRLADHSALRDLAIIRVNSREVRVWDRERWFIDPATRDASVVPPAWDDERAAHVAQTYGLQMVTVPAKRIRHEIGGDDVMLFDGWSLYRSFSIVPFFPMFRWGRALSVVTNLRGPQRVVNKMASQQLHILNTTANSGWLVEQNSLVNMSTDDLAEYGSKSGLVLEYRKGSQPPEKLKPNQLSQAHDRLEFLAKENIKEISTINDSALGDDREDVAAKAIVAKQQRGQVNLRRYMSNEQRTMYLLGRKILELVQAYYTEPRILRITGENPLSGASETEDIGINQRTPTGEILNNLSIGEYDVVITSTPARDNMQETTFEEAMRLKEAGVQIPDSVLVRNSSLENKIEVAQSMENDPISAQMREAELLFKQMEIVDKFTNARKRDAEATQIINESGDGGAEAPTGESPQTQLQTERVMKLLQAAQDGEIKRLAQPRGGQNA
jgi:hypothetical protein